MKRSGTLRAVMLAVLTVSVSVFVPVSVAGAAQADSAAASAGDPGSLTIFRVDVSRYPQVGLVVTVPGTPGSTFTVTTRSGSVRPEVRKLSPGDVEIAFVPGTGLPRAALREQQVAAIRFLAGLPAGERTITVAPATPGTLHGQMSGDHAPAIASVGSLAGGSRSTAAESLATALSAFMSGSRVRRTVVLVISRHEPLSRPLQTRFRDLLAAGGTSLYLLDAVPGGAPAAGPPAA